MKESNPVLKRILLTVNLDDASLAMAKQVAELAKDHGAALLLLHVADTAFSGFFCTESFIAKINHKNALLKTWQRSLQVVYGIQVSIEVCYGNRATCILSAAREKNADLVALTRPPARKWWAGFKRDPVETVMRRSPCQVMTLFSEAPSTSEWKNIVIPVIGFIPEIRIKTIYRIARNSQVKIHLVTLDNTGAGQSSPEFSFIMDTLKILKSAGNIQVECSCIKRSANPEQSFVQYADKIQADVLMTSKRIPQSGWQAFRRGMLRPFQKLNANGLKQYINLRSDTAGFSAVQEGA
jgi:nucleotide-binding universal stress UspA family protein